MRTAAALTAALLAAAAVVAALVAAAADAALLAAADEATPIATPAHTVQFTAAGGDRACPVDGTTVHRGPYCALRVSGPGARPANVEVYADAATATDDTRRVTTGDTTRFFHRADGDLLATVAPQGGGSGWDVTLDAGPWQSLRVQITPHHDHDGDTTTRPVPVPDARRSLTVHIDGAWSCKPGWQPRPGADRNECTAIPPGQPGTLYPAPTTTTTAAAPPPACRHWHTVVDRRCELDPDKTEQRSDGVRVPTAAALDAGTEKITTAETTCTAFFASAEVARARERGPVSECYKTRGADGEVTGTHGYLYLPL